MKKIYLLSILIVSSLVVYSQTGNSMKDYEKGTAAAKSGKFQESITFFSRSIDELPTADAYYNRAAVYYELGDTCNFCKDLNSAVKLNDSDAKKLYFEKCTFTKIVTDIPDSIRLNHPGISHIEIVRYFCKYDSTINFVSDSKSVELLTENIDYENDKPYVVVENMPEYPGGDKAMRRFLSKNIHYPQTARRNGIQGTVYVAYIVERDGSIGNVKLLTRIGGGCDEEAIRVVKSMPNWIPGTQSGKKVRVQFNLPIKFSK